MNKRKAFNFYHSYYDVAKELSEKDRLKFLWSIIQKQFDGVEPKLEGKSHFAYLSQKHSIDSQVAGYETKTGAKLTPTEGGTQGASQGASVQGKGKGKGEVQLSINFVGLLSFLNATLGKKFQVINESTKKKYNARINDGYSKEDIFNAITNISNDDFHKESNFKWCTPEYFSRSATLDKYGFQSAPIKPKKVIVPHY